MTLVGKIFTVLIFVMSLVFMAFAVAVYSGYLVGKEPGVLAPHIRIPTGTPPVLLVHAGDDTVSDVENSVVMYGALKRAGVPAELHIYSNTAHDFGVRTNDRPYATWTASCAYWLRDRGFLRRSAKE